MKDLEQQQLLNIITKEVNLIKPYPRARLLGYMIKHQLERMDKKLLVID